MDKPINVGLIGFGMAGRVFHAPVIAAVDGLRLHKVSARKPEQREILQARYPEAVIVAHADEIIHAEDIDLVVVATSNEVHHSLTQAALLAGKHVVVEKPFTNTVAEADELVALAKARGLLVSVHHNARWNSDYLTVKKVIENGRLGRLVSFEARYDRFRNALKENAWREANLPGSGILYDLGAHLIDQSLQLFGKPEAINADLRTQRPGAQAVDDFELILHYPQLKVSLKGAMLVKEPSPRYALYGLDGAFVKYGIDPQEAALKAGESPKGNPNWGREPRDSWGKLNVLEDGVDVIEYIESERGNYPAFYRNIREAIAGESGLAVKPAEARDVIYVIEMAERSWAERRTVDLRF
ncbi:oxidoreductase [Parapedobacter koreensis]|uniref:Predicted dehydrogenase n=1 Tax=Parapedobacter koreensis TaxID=332977 RepID=A0A1H7LEP7_9SPHI|nr:oxidoreductase [Parapedobacter koreensis]SEK96985.1 Predicted dehydrogenase [Parapedobacter koreensis]